MTRLLIDLSDVLDRTHPDDAVTVWAPTFREGARGQLVQPRRQKISLVDGKGEATVEPGPLMVQIYSPGARQKDATRLVIPDQPEVTLTAVMEEHFAYTPEVMGRVNLDAQRAEDAAVRAEGQVQAASDAALSASGSAASASASAIASSSSAGNAADSQIAAGEHSAAAASSASAAADSASAATGAADRAAGSESQAASSASAAASSASAADSAATSAEAVADSTHWQDDRLSVMGQLGPSLTGPKGDKGDPGDGNGDVLWSELDPVLDGKAPESHTHPSTGISDATTVGRSVLTASSQAAARQAIGAGTSSLALGTTSATAKAGNYQPTAANITDATTVGRNVLKAADAAAARAAIGAGTSSLALGTTSATAAAGDHTHSEYPTIADLHWRTPEIRVVTTMPTSPMPDVVYMRFG